MRSSVQVSAKLRKRLARRKRHPRQSYEEVIAEALDATEISTPEVAPRRIALPRRTAEALADVERTLRRLYRDRLVRLVLYGSAARGDMTPASDVDLLLVLEGEVDRARELKRIVDATYAALLAHGVHVSVLPMAETEFLTRATPLLLNVRREGIPL